MASFKDSLVKRSPREIISDAESTLENLKQSDIYSTQTFQKFSYINRLITEIKSVPGSDLYKTLIDQLGEYSSLLQRVHSSRPRGEVEPPGFVGELVNEGIKFYHTYQKDGFTGEYSTCNGASETIAQTDLLSLVQKENMEIMNRTIDIDHLSFDIGFSPPFNGGGGIFIIRLDRGLDRANRPSNFEYWYFLVDTEPDKLHFLDSIQKTYAHVYGKPNNYLHFLSNTKPNMEVIESMFTPGKHFFNSEKKYWSTVRDICNLVQKVPISWLSTRIWLWLSDGHHPSQRQGLKLQKRETPSSRLDVKVLVELVNTEFDILFGDHETITGASHNLKIHHQICNVFTDSHALLQFYSNINHLDSFIYAIVRTNDVASTDNLASLLMFKWFGLLQVEQSTIEQLHGHIKEKSSFKWPKFLLKYLGSILELAPSKSIGSSGLESLNKLIDVTTDENIKFLLNYNCWNSDVVDFFKERMLLNNIDEIISKKTVRLETINSSLYAEDNKLNSSEKTFFKYQALNDKNDVLLRKCDELSSKIFEIEKKFQAFRKTPNLLNTISDFSTELDKPTRKKIKRLKPSSSLTRIIKRESKIDKKNQTSQLRSFFYLHYWNYLKRIDAGKDLTVMNHSFKIKSLELEQVGKELKDFQSNFPDLDVKITELKDRCKTLREEKSSLEKELNNLKKKKKLHQNQSA
jgi:hypothetical protein